MKSIVNEVKDITECSICTEMFTNPKMLPCFHTFCLKCIEEFCEKKEEGDTLPCPVCRKEFVVPTGGLSKLSVNFFVERLIAVQSASSLNEVVNCDVCHGCEAMHSRSFVLLYGMSGIHVRSMFQHAQGYEDVDATPPFNNRRSFNYGSHQK